jgi:glyoxylase-like metal-dependent hydrolase (beta-lactamase superfamily II)
MPVKVHSLWLGMSSAHLVETEGGMLLVDAGPPRSAGRVLGRMRALGRDDLRLIFVTHAHLDHYGSAAALRRATGAPIAIHRLDREAMARAETRLGSVRGRGRLGKALLPALEFLARPEPTVADLVLEDGDHLGEYGTDGIVIHTPGHTPGSSTLLIGGRVAFVGDLISTVGWPRVQSQYAHDWTQVAASLRRVQALKPERVYAGHGCRPVSERRFRALSSVVRGI